MIAREKKVVQVAAPKFQTEQQEAEWWFENRALVEDLLIRHGRRSVVPTKSVTMRLPVTDIDCARRLASKSGVGYQTYIKGLLHSALTRAEKRAS